MVLGGCLCAPIECSVVLFVLLIVIALHYQLLRATTTRQAELNVSTSVGGHWKQAFRQFRARDRRRYELRTAVAHESWHVTTDMWVAVAAAAPNTSHRACFEASWLGWVCRSRLNKCRV